MSIARDLTITLAGGEAVQLHGAWLAFGCGDPQAISVQADPAEPATQLIMISAELSDLGSANAGGTLDFTVTLTSHGEDRISFAECPSYSMGIKEAGVSERYLLNCSDVDVIQAGGSVTYAMRLEVPADAAGTDVLTWSLDGYAAVDSADISTS